MCYITFYGANFHDTKTVHCDKFIADVITFAKRSYTDIDIDEFKTIDDMMGKRFNYACSQIHSCDYHHCECSMCEQLPPNILSCFDSTCFSRPILTDRNPSTYREMSNLVESFWDSLNIPLAQINNKSANN